MRSIRLAAATARLLGPAGRRVHSLAPVRDAGSAGHSPVRFASGGVVVYIGASDSDAMNVMDAATSKVLQKPAVEAPGPVPRDAM